ncbi:hypothetical protein LXA43DRAFT_983033 [Ganoderma leucocontextum]|nr:hypothetical protein LXA43DRAFT_983033 [Ganoderma leucocontextum]
MSATQTMVAPLPLPTLSQEVIDVDALEDDGSDSIVFSGFRRAANQGSPRRLADRLAEDGLAYMGFRASSTSSTGGRRSHTSGGAQAGPSRAISDDIIILESDDEGGPSSSSSRAPRSNMTRSRLVSPPPPRTQRGNTPAVPALPPHLASQSSFPRRRQRPAYQAPYPPPSIRPRADPLPFEARILPQLPPRHAFGAAPRSHHQPAMGFGGAILALNRQSALEEANRRERDARSNAFNLPSFTEMFRRMTSGLADSGAPESAAGSGSGRTRWQRLWPWAFDEPDAEIGRNLSPASDDDMLFDLLPPLGNLHRSMLEKPIHWKPEYTHPNKAGPGFTHDFAPSEGEQSSAFGSPSPIIVLDEDEAGPSHAGSSSSSATAVETTLVCARCLDPLILGAPHGATEDERKKCRVWALRCGHMLDGKCIAELYAPPSFPLAAIEEEPVKGKGKARADPDLDTDASQAKPRSDVQPDEPAVPIADRKGKRKAVEPLEPESPSKRARIAEPALEGNSIRSRLRSHARLAAAADAAPPEASTASTYPHPSPTRRSQRYAHAAPSGSASGSGPGTGSGAGRGKGKGKGKARVGTKPAIEAEHEWKCPVAGCGRVHYGVRVQGEWKNDEGRGAIALFV